VELAAGMGPTSCFDDPASFVEWMKSRISIGLESSVEALEMALGVLSAPVGREGEPDRRRNRIGAISRAKRVVEQIEVFTQRCTRRA